MIVNIRKVNRLLIGCFVFAGYFLSCASKKLSTTSNVDEPISFPGAEGYGKYTTGGRGGKVVIVANLNNDGDGSLRAALKISGPKIIIFSISGTIHLLSPLSIPANVTIAGQTAPGDGVCLADQPLVVGGDNVIVRFLRFRLGDRYQDKGKVDGSGHDDAFTAYRRKNIMIDHCSFSWSTDEVFSVYEGDSATVQWNVISEPLNYSYHFEKGSSDYQRHGYGGIWGGRGLTAHHNLIAHCTGRTPRFNGIRGIPEERVDYRNNVIYNWGGVGIYGGEGGQYNLVNNYFKSGPSTLEKVKYQIANPWQQPPSIPFGKWYVAGNYVDGSASVSANNWLGVKLQNGNSAESIQKAKAIAPFAAIPFSTQSAADAYVAVLSNAGASLPKRDTLDQRIIEDVKQRTGRIIDVQGGFAHGTPYEVSKTAWPELRSLTAPKDSDRDGMPDEWEKSKGLNSNDPNDASLKNLSRHYTNIEMYINGLVTSL